MREDTPPSSVNGDDEIVGFDEEEMIYYGDADEFIEELENENDVIDEDDEEDDDELIEMAERQPPDNSNFVYKHHQGSVFCVSIHPNGKYAVSGGEDDKAYIWDMETGNVLQTCTEHSDSVIAASFSFDGIFLMTADMRGNIYVRRCATEENNSWDVVWSFQTGDLLWGFWHPAAHVLVCCESEGDAYIWKIPSGETKMLRGHGKSSACGVFLRDGKRLAIGYDDGSIKIWDLKTATSLFHITSDDTNTESGQILCIDSFHDNNLIVAGSYNGKIIIAKSNTGKIIGNLSLDSAIESVKFSKNPNLGLIAAGSLGGIVAVWDVARQALRYKCQYEDGSGITSVMWIDDDIAATYFNGYTKVFDGKSGSELHTFSGHKSEVLDINYNSAKKFLMTASDDGTCRLYDMKTFKSESA